jgi:hypothetical protein
MRDATTRGWIRRAPRTMQPMPAIAALVAVLVGLIAAVEYSVPVSPQYGLTTLYLWPIALAALWFGSRIAVGVVAAVMLIRPSGM